MNERLEIDSDEAREHAPPAPPRRPIKSVLLFIAVMGLAGGSWWAYRDMPRLPPSEVPVIHSDKAPVKEAPSDPGGMIVPGQDSVLLNREGKSNPRVEQLLPEPEQALPRPVAPVKPAAPVETATAPPKATVQPTIAAPAALPGAPQNPIAAPPEIAPAAPPAVIARPPAVTAAAPTPALAQPQIARTPTQTPVAGSGYHLQLGAVRTEEGAKQEWQRLQRAQPDVLGKLSLTTARVDLGEKGIFYRIQAGPIADGAAAAQSCATLKSRNVGCILVRP